MKLLKSQWFQWNHCDFEISYKVLGSGGCIYSMKYITQQTTYWFGSSVRAAQVGGCAWFCQMPTVVCGKCQFGTICLVVRLCPMTAMLLSILTHPRTHRPLYMVHFYRMPLCNEKPHREIKHPDHVPTIKRVACIWSPASHKKSGIYTGQYYNESRYTQKSYDLWTLEFVILYCQIL